MTPESRNSSFQTTTVKRFPPKCKTAQQQKKYISMQRRGKHSSVATEELLVDGVFYVVPAEILQT